MEYKDRPSVLQRTKDFLFVKKENRISGITISAAVILCLLLLSAFLFFRPKKNKNLALPKESFADKFIYKKDTIKFLDTSEDITFFGKIAYDENQVIPVYSLVSGNVEDVAVTVGNYVSKGQELAKIRSGDISKIVNDYKAAEANFGIAQKNLAVAETLYKAKFSSKLDVLNARKDYEKARSELKNSKNMLDVYHTSADKKEPFFNITAPIDGYIVDKKINNNMEIRGDNSINLFTISDLKTVWVYANVFEEDISKIKEDQQVTVTTLAFPDKLFKGVIDNIASVLDPASRTVRVRIIIENKEQLLKPEMAARIQVHIAESHKMLAVEPKAIIFDKDRYFVIKVEGKHFKIIPVDVMRKTSEHTFFKADAKEGDLVVGEGSLIIYNEIVNRP